MRRWATFKMLGKTHYKIGILYYLIFSTIPVFSLSVLKNQPINVIILNIITTGCAALLPDIDCSSSIAYTKNPIGIVISKGIAILQKMLATIIHLTFTIGSAYLIYKKRDRICIYLVKKFSINTTKIKIAIYIFVGILIFLGLAGKHNTKKIPIIGKLYKTVGQKISKNIYKTKRLILTVIYISLSILIAYYNYTHWNKVIIYTASLLIISAVIFPHRTLLHSLEGFLLISIVSYNAFKIEGYIDTGKSFIIGYGTHLYLSDIFTDTGIPFTFIGYMLGRLPKHELWAKNRLYRSIYKVLCKRLKISIIKTGTPIGSLLENVYVLGLIIILYIIF